MTANLTVRRNVIFSAQASDTLMLHATPRGRLETSLRQKPLPISPLAESPTPGAVGRTPKTPGF